MSPAANPTAAFAESCLRYSPEVAVRAGEAVFLEVGKCRSLYSEDGIARRLEALARRFGFQCRVAVADTAPTALAMARYPSYHRTKNLRDLPLEALPDLLSPFRADPELRKELEAMTGAMERLGVRNAGELAALPPKQLASRFGKRALQLMSLIWGDLEPAWPGFHPAPRISEKAPHEGVGFESILFVLRKLVDRAMARLRGKGERASVIEIELDLEKWSTSRQSSRRSWKMELPLPQGSAAGLMPILRERMQFDLNREPLRAPVQGVRFEVIESVPGGGAQSDFFNRSEEESEAWDALVARLAQKLGKENVFVAQVADRHLPERAYRRTMLSGAQAAGESPAGAPEIPPPPPEPERPARVLKRPEPLEREGRVLRSLSGRQWRVLSWNGPERLSGEWWTEVEEFHRDYFRVVTEGGEQLWVFLNRKSKTPSFYLHGYFD